MQRLKTGTDLIPAARLVDKTLVAEINGEIDLNTSPDLRTALFDLVQQHAPARLVLNLAKVPYMDSSALAVLIETLKLMRRSEGKVYLTDLQPHVRGLLEIARLDAIFAVVDSEQAALEDGQTEK